MNGHGGKRPGAGRPPGARNRKTMELVEACAATGEMPLDYMLRIMRDPNADVARRDAMAAKAAPYLHPQLASVRQQNEQAGRVVHEVRWIDQSDECPGGNSGIGGPGV